MTAKSDTISPQLKALRKTDLSPIIRMSGMMLPKMFQGFFDCLEPKQKKVFNKIMPAGGKKQIYIHLTDTPTPPITILLAHPPKIRTLPEKDLNQKEIKGLRIKTEQIQLLSSGITFGNIFKLLWQLKSQFFPILSLSSIFTPILGLGPAGIKDLINKANTRFKPLLEMLPHSKK